MSDTLNNKGELVPLCDPHLKVRSGNNRSRKYIRFKMCLICYQWTVITLYAEKWCSDTNYVIYYPIYAYSYDQEFLKKQISDPRSEHDWLGVLIIFQITNIYPLLFCLFPQPSLAASLSPAMRKSSYATLWALPHTLWYWARTVLPATSCSTVSLGRDCCHWAQRPARLVKESRAPSAKDGSCVSPTGGRRGSVWRCLASMSWCTSWRLTVAAGIQFPGKTWRSTRNVRTQHTG